jgi:hypothetical protein
MTHTDEALTTRSFSPEPHPTPCHETPSRKPYQAPVCRRISLSKDTEGLPSGRWYDGGTPSQAS